MPTIFYKIFNKEIKLNSKNLKILIIEIKKLFAELKNNGNIDSLKVLRNKIEHLLEDREEIKEKKIKKEVKAIKSVLDEIEEFIDKKETEKKETLIDVVKEVEDNYKDCSKLSEEKKKKYKCVCVKKKIINYEKELIELQVELLKLQKHIKDKGEKLLIIFEGRDAAGKGGTIKRFREYLNPRGAKVVALNKPTDKERTEWYFQRYVNHLPSGGEIAFFDRSWYNRGGVEPVMGFVSKSSYEQFLEDAPKFERMLTKSGIKIIKFYFSVSKEEQAKRFEKRRRNPLKQFKLSPVDQFSQQLWDKYTLAEYKNFSKTHHPDAPWVMIKSNDKKKARINAIKYVLSQFEYPEKINPSKLTLDDDIVYDGAEKVRRLEKEIDINEDLFS
ncbi:polyphosphate kinase 2 [Candidatus Gracilibacteria bacterium]|nr:MAG: polyphosphate kinase 2 [Candidatus Gracilibacteria bacterium]PIE85424.1 MAG: polyphosphate kinase 2 [Candidatus Gracilibacteria bacterium]